MWQRFCFLLPNQVLVLALHSAVPAPCLRFTFLCSSLFLVACGLDRKTTRVCSMRALLGLAFWVQLLPEVPMSAFTLSAFGLDGA